MNEMQNQLARLEARIEHQTARIDTLYRALEREGIFPRPVAQHPRYAVPSARWEVADVPSNRRRKRLPVRRRAAGFRLGNATGV